MFPQFSCLTSHFSRSSRLQLRNAPCKLRFQLANTSHLLPHIHKLALEHGLHFGTGVILCRNASSSLTSLSENPNSWVMPHKFEIANPPSIEQAIPARAATCSLSESESLREAVSRRLAPAFAGFPFDSRRREDCSCASWLA